MAAERGSPAAASWAGFRFHRLTQVPRHDPGRDGAPTRTAGALLAALDGSHSALLAGEHRSPLLMSAWVRDSRQGRLHVVLGGRPFFPPGAAARERQDGGGDGARRLLFPPGAQGVDLDGGDLDALLAGLPSWVPVAGRPDALWAPADGRRAGLARRGAFERCALHLDVPFAWLVLARPLSAEEVEGERQELVNLILPLAGGETSESRRVALERSQGRHRELSRLQHGGLWEVRVLAGGADPRTATVAASLLAAAGELDGLPYVLAPGGPAADLATALSRGGEGSDGQRPAFAASGELLAALTAPPTSELPGLRLVEPHTFDVAADPTGDDPGVVLGTVLDEAGVEAGELALSPASLNRHVFVCGATGSGKSQTIRHLLEQATRRGLPWLAVEPAKAEYASMATRLADQGAEVVVVRPGDPDRPPAGFNPLEPQPGFPLQTHIDLLRALFLAAFEAQEPLPQILATALKRAYEEQGWDVALGEPARPGGRPRHPTLGDLQRVAEQVVDEVGYGKEVADNVRGFIRVRLASLRLGTTGRFFEGGHPLDLGRLHRANVVLEIEDIGDDADKAFFMGAVLVQLTEHLRVSHRSGTAPRGLRHLTVIEEAHRLLRQPGPGAGAGAHAVETFASLLAEVRAYGEGLVIAEQIPSKLVPDVIKNTAVKVVHRLPAGDDRDRVGATMNVDAAQSRALVSLVPGQAAVFADGMDRPMLVRMPDGSGREASAPVEPAPVTELIGRRSPTCGDACRAVPCSLRQMRAAQQLLSDRPWLVAWAELAVLGHLTGCRLPLPRPERLAGLAPADPRTVACALSHAVDDAVAVRSPLLAPTVSPADLSAHVATALGRLLGGSDPGCDDDRMAFLAHPFRWERARHALARDAAPPGSGRHPATAEWEAALGAPIPGATRAEQLAAVTERLAADWRDARARTAVAHGTRRPSTLDGLVGPGPDVAAGVRVLLEPFVDCAWPLIHLVPDEPVPDAPARRST
ncbi:MAG: ATP-binding protein [Acidimicrobiia bacterium]